MTGTSLDALAGASHSCTIQVALTYSVQSLIELHIYIYIHAYIYANMCSVIIHVIQCHIICSCKGTPKNKMASLYYPLLMQGDVPYLMHLQHGVVRIPMLGTQLSTKHPAILDSVSKMRLITMHVSWRTVLLLQQTCTFLAAEHPNKKIWVGTSLGNVPKNCPTPIITCHKLYRYHFAN